MNGWDFLRIIQDHPVLASIPTVAISGVRTFAAAKVLGPQEGLDKPLDLGRLVALVRRYCDSSNTT
jgi:hypothetical protein